MRAINLLPKDDARRNQKTQWIVIVPVVLAVILTAAFSAMFLSASGKVKDRKAELSSVLPDDVWLSTVSAKAPVSSSVATAPAAPAAGASVAATGLTLDGYTYSQPAVARLLTRLAVVPDLVNVQLQQSTLAKIGTTPVVHFTIAADVRKPGGGS